MNTYQTRPHTVICSLCSEDIPPGTEFQLDDFMDAEDGTFCMPCVQEFEAHYAENPQADQDDDEDEYCEDGDASRKFALENRD